VRNFHDGPVSVSVGGTFVGHQNRVPRSATSIGSRIVLTRNVSARTPMATTMPISLEATMGRMASTEKVPARMSPAEVRTPPVLATPLRTPAVIPSRITSSRTLVRRKML
jgi:hypothetical protein